MIGSRARVPSGRGSLAVAAVGAMVAALLALLGVTAPPAQAADVITFRAGAEAAWNQTTARVTIPAAVRETDGMLLFVTTNKDVEHHGAAGGLDPEGTVISSTDTETTLYSRVAIANDAGRNAAVTFSAITKSTMTLLAYDGTAADPTALVASAAETTNRATHTTPGGQRRDRGFLRRVLLGGQVRRRPRGLDPARRPDPAQHHRRHRHRPDLRRGLRPQRRGRRRRQHPAAPRPAPPRAPRRPCGPSCSGPTRTANPNVAPVASFTVNCPTATCTVDGSAST